ncbi:MAG: TonB-dependent receptor, partial [Myxococcota bacterium]
MTLLGVSRLGAVVAATTLLQPAIGFAQDADDSAPTGEEKAAGTESDAAEGEQVSGDEVEVITVTTQKREQSVTDVPLSVGVLNGTFLEENGLFDLDDAAEYIPGFQLQLQQINTPSFVIRGISSDVSDPEAEPNVSVFFDGIPGSRSSGSVIELFDLERIEVAKGPQGTLFSRGASNGAVNFIFRKPEFDRYAEVGVQLGNFNNRRVQALVNAPLDDDRAAVRFGLVYHDRDGYVESSNEEGATYNGKETLHLRGSLRLEPIDDLVFNFITYFQEDTPEQTSFKTMVPSLAQLDPFTEYTGDPEVDPVDGFGPSAQTPGTFIRRRLTGVTNLIDWDLSDELRISSTTGYRRSEADENFDTDGTSLPLLTGEESITSDVIFQEFRFTWSPDLPISMFGGVSFYQEEASLNRVIGFDQDPLFNNVLPLITGTALPVTFGGLGDITEETFTENKTTSFSAFIDGTFDIVEDFLSITGGARITEDQKDYSYTSPTAGDGSALTLAFADLGFLPGALAGNINDVVDFVNSIPRNPFSPGNSTLSNGSTGLLDLLGIPAALVPSDLETNALDGTTNGAVLSTDTVFQYIEPRAVLEVRPVENMLVYASFARGIRSGGLDINPRNGATEDEFRRRIKKESIRSYELGIKGSADLGVGRFTGESAFFIYDYKNFQTLLFIDGQSVA